MFEVVRKLWWFRRSAFAAGTLGSRIKHGRGHAQFVPSLTQVVGGQAWVTDSAAQCALGPGGQHVDNEPLVLAVPETGGVTIRFNNGLGVIDWRGIHIKPRPTCSQTDRDPFYEIHLLFVYE
jgi:hypothetical protein